MSHAPPPGPTARYVLSDAAEQPGRRGAQLDLIFRSGTILDGSGSARFTGDVGVDDGFIVEVGDLSARRATTEIDATGLVIAPGFIDVHSHGEPAALHQATSSLRQGVTTEILQPDGGGTTNIAECLSIGHDGLAINVGAYIGFNSVWRHVIGNADRRPTPAEIASMQNLVVRGLQDGAWGVSAGLQYVPAHYARTDEVVSVVAAAHPWRTNFPHHIRNEEHDVLEATRETIEIGERAGLVPVITHMKVGGSANWGASVKTVGLIQDAIARGIYAAADVYPYLGSQTGIQVRVPAWALDGGREAMLERFRDPALREQIARAVEAEILKRTADFDGVYFPSKHRSLAELADKIGGSAGEAVIRILEDEGNLYAITDFGVEEDIRRIMQNPTTAIASDGGATTSSTTHPRRYGTQPRVLGHYVRELGYLGLEDAIRKMTGLPATMIGMVDRGFLAPGMVADITVFDPGTVIDTATFDQPRQFPEGIEHVVVNGRLALRDGEPTGVRAGTALRRVGAMISRPMTPAGPARASAVGRLEEAGLGGSADYSALVACNVTFDGGETRGEFVLDGPDGTFRSTRLGMLQTAPGWATVTGRGTIAADGSERSFLVMLDENDPLHHGETTVTVHVQHGPSFTGVLREGSTRLEAGAR